MVAMAVEAKLCDVCDDPAKFFCPMDSAFLCGDCDVQIHEANLVARKHQRLMVSLMGDSRRTDGGGIALNCWLDSKGVMQNSNRGSRMAMGVSSSPGGSGGGIQERQNRGEVVDLTHGESEEWPRLDAVPITPKNREISPSTMVLKQNQISQSTYKPSTKGGKLRASRLLAEEICQQIFSPVKDRLLVDLEGSYQQLESSVERMKEVEWGSASSKQGLSPRGGGGEGTDNQVVDVRFSHSWVPDGPGPGPGWYWIPKGDLTLDTCYPLRLGEINRFGHLARRVRRLPPPAPLLSSFAKAVGKNMANRGLDRPMKRRQEDWRQEGWMDEDDLLEEDFKRDQDLRRQLQRVVRKPGEGAVGRRSEIPVNRVTGFGDRGQEWAGTGKGALVTRQEGSQVLQGGWNQNPSGRFQGHQGGWA